MVVIEKLLLMHSTTLESKSLSLGFFLALWVFLVNGVLK